MKIIAHVLIEKNHKQISAHPQDKQRKNQITFTTLRIPKLTTRSLEDNNAIPDLKKT